LQHGFPQALRTHAEGVHFGAIATSHAGGVHWSAWSDGIRASLRTTQRGAGAKELAGTWPTPGAPTVADQAKLAMCLEVYYRRDRVWGAR
jgi:hypothetical protein